VRARGGRGRRQRAPTATRLAIACARLYMDGALGSGGAALFLARICFADRTRRGESLQGCDEASRGDDEQTPRGFLFSCCGGIGALCVGPLEFIGSTLDQKATRRVRLGSVAPGPPAATVIVVTPVF